MLAVLLLSSETALGHGGLSSLGALRGLVVVIFGAYVIALCVGGIILHILTKRRRRADGRRFFLRDPGIPPGLRGLLLVQYALAFICAQVVIIPLLDRYLLEQFDIVYFLIFSALAVFSANGLATQSVNRGFRPGMALGWYGIIGAGLFLYREGWRAGFEWVTFTYGLWLLIALHWKYRPYFGVDRPAK